MPKTRTAATSHHSVTQRSILNRAISTIGMTLICNQPPQCYSAQHP